MNDNPYQILDDILECYKDDVTGNFKMKLLTSEIQQQIKDKPSFQYKIFQGALDQLNEDKYLKLEPLTVEEHNFNADLVADEFHLDAYKLTFKGITLIYRGGYIAKIERENSNLILNQRLTWAIALGTVFAGIFGVIECIKLLWRFLDWYCSCK